MPATCVPWPLASSNGPAPSTREVLVERRVWIDVGVFLEVRVILVDARVHHRPRDAAAMRRERILRRIGLHRGNRLVDAGRDFEVGPDVKDRAVAPRLDLPPSSTHRSLPGVALRRGLRLGDVELHELLDRAPFQPGEEILAVGIVLLPMQLLSRVAHVGIRFGRVRCCRSPIGAPLRGRPDVRG